MGAQGSSERHPDDVSRKRSSASRRASDLSRVPHAENGDERMSSLTDDIMRLVNTNPDVPTSQADTTAEPPPMEPPLEEVEPVPAVFRFPRQEQPVYVSGSFNEWQVKILLEYDEDEGDCSEVLYLAPGSYFYRFIIGTQWAVNRDDEVISLDGVEYNRMEVNPPVFEDMVTPYVDSDEDESGLLEGKKKVYGQHIPAPNEYIKDCPKMPPFLSQQILNHNDPCSVDPYVLSMPSHVTLNHIYTQQRTDEKVRVVSMTQRFKTRQFAQSSAKFVTTVYYTPLPANQKKVKKPTTIPVQSSDNTIVG